METERKEKIDEKSFQNVEGEQSERKSFVFTYMFVLQI